MVPKEGYWPPDCGGVYIVLAKGLGRYKIGVASQSVRDRFKGLQCCCPVELEVVLVMIDGTFKEEQLLHRKFAASRLHGEWFSESPELLTYIAERVG